MRCAWCRRNLIREATRFPPNRSAADSCHFHGRVVPLPTEHNRKGPAMRFIRLGLGATVAILALAALALPTFGAPRANTLTGTDGPGFTITMNKATVKAGTYTIT